MTTLMIDDELSRQAQQAAAAQGKSLNEFVHDVLKQAVDKPSVRFKTRSGLPVIDVTPAVAIEPQIVQQILAEEGF
jgi:hypothetical protein